MEERLQRKIDARNKTTITIQYYYVQQKTDHNFWCKYDDAMQITYIDNFKYFKSVWLLQTFKVWSHLPVKNLVISIRLVCGQEFCKRAKMFSMHILFVFKLVRKLLGLMVLIWVDNGPFLHYCRLFFCLKNFAKMSPMWLF